MLKRCILNWVYEIVFFGVILSLFIMGRHEDCYLAINSFWKAALVVKGGLVVPLVIAITIGLSANRIKPDHLEIISSMIAIPSSGWFWYVASLYFNKENNCKTEAKHLFYLHTLLALEALWFFWKLCLIVIVLTGFLLTLFIQNYLNCRSANRRRTSIKEKIFARKSLNMSFSKVDPDEFCIIWMEVYKKEDELIRLPWTKKHFFHSKCIGDWISVTPKCPLWNTDIDASMSVWSDS